jgi:hypothetical protein
MPLTIANNSIVVINNTATYLPVFHSTSREYTLSTTNCIAGLDLPNALPTIGGRRLIKIELHKVDHRASARGGPVLFVLDIVAEANGGLPLSGAKLAAVQPTSGPF